MRILFHAVILTHSLQDSFLETLSDFNFVFLIKTKIELASLKIRDIVQLFQQQNGFGFFFRHCECYSATTLVER